ncbi:hypothetical protein NAT51_12945 [Flavobacterium amniphilum]|uniref:hypothetical protein n=1 Tax=Flavobacterium amniphilum TaxID=1834035 RepID=UPI00202A4B93|nr:hypothetical protein [Flavobacterium amniphilum]MCL9806437.1 hypothetical protein [Flavobacterium amniphilum]
MKYKHLYITIGLSLIITSCKEELQPQESSGAVRAEQNQPTANQTTATTKTAAQPTVQTTQTTPANTGTQTQGALNPAHGQPGHRCDIAVGAPLNSKPAPAPAPGNKTITTQNIQAAPQIVSAPVKTAKGMNPPHGQPGHRCDIAVGEPLNSKPTKPATTANTTNAYTVSPTNNSTGIPGSLPPPAATPAPVVETAPGMNPPHGQPGHVCGIAVGAPLNSEKKEEKK